MLFFDENNFLKEYKLLDKIGGSMFGKVYKISEDKCIKIFKIIDSCYKTEALKIIREKRLDNFYELYNLLYDENKNFVGYTMKYYPKEDIDLLTMPIDYTLDNLNGIYKSIMKLNENKIWAQDTHIGNVILEKDQITIIDADLYAKCLYMPEMMLKERNIDVICSIFRNLYIDSLKKYHKELSYEEINKINNLFMTNIDFTPSEVHKKLTKYKYPIDYIK